MKAPVIGAMLIAIVVCPTCLAIPSTSQLQPWLLDVQTEREIKTVEVLGEIIPTVKIVQIEKWSNGTKLHMVFYHLLNPSDSSAELENVTYLTPEEMNPSRVYYGTDSTPPKEVVITYTKWITDASTSETGKALETKTADVNPTTGVYYPHRRWIDENWFVLKGRFGDVFVTYDHNDNYNREEDGGCYPLQANTPYILRGRLKPYHIHLTKDLLDAWVWGNLTAVVVVGATFLAKYAIKELIEEGLVAVSVKIAAALKAPIVVAILFLWDIVETLRTVQKLSGFINEARWVEGTVREHFLGDGWAWRGPILGWEFIGWCWCPYLFKPMTGWGIYQHREFEQTWGAEGIFGEPHKYTIKWYDRTEWKSAPTSAIVDGAGKYFRTWP